MKGEERGRVKESEVKRKKRRQPTREPTRSQNGSENTLSPSNNSDHQ